MTEKELQKKSRQDLLELLLEAEKENVSLREENEALRSELEERQLRLGKIGSIAEASLQVTNIFEEAEKAAKIYLQNLRRRHG